MDNSSLNASHRYARQAHKLFRSGKYEEAIASHELARQKIDEALLLITVPKVQESLRLQKQFHSKAIDLIIVRKEQHEKCLAAQTVVDKGQKFQNDLDSSRQVQIELFKSLDNVEKVVEVLEQKTLTGTNRDASEFLSGLFDDLKLFNQQSMQLVNRLVSLLDDRISENEDLRELLEGRVAQPKTASLQKDGKSRELTDSDHEELNKMQLPPLELPTFDFSSLSTDTRGEAEGKKENETEATAKDEEDSGSMLQQERDD